MTALISRSRTVLFVYPTCVVAGFVPDFQAKQARVEGQLDNATNEPTTGRQHFRLDRHRARILATLQDRVWRSTMLLELCRSAFSRINEVLFPTGPQPQGIHALLGLFRSVRAIRGFITQKLVDRANATMAYIRSQCPNMQLRPPMPGSSLSHSHLDDTFDHATVLVECYHAQLMGHVLSANDEPED